MAVIEFKGDAQTPGVLWDMIADRAFTHMPRVSKFYPFDRKLPVLIITPRGEFPAADQSNPHVR